MSRDKVILLSLKPCFAQSILARKKLFEFRKVKIKENTQHILLYASSPLKALVGFATVEKIIEDSPNNLWHVAGKEGGISRRLFFSYFKGKKNAYAIKIKTVYKFDTMIDPKKIVNNFRPPQSFMYAKKEFLENILEMINEK